MAPYLYIPWCTYFNFDGDFEFSMRKKKATKLDLTAQKNVNLNSKSFLFSTASNPALRPTKPPIQ
jgi:hypothetical protein